MTDPRDAKIAELRQQLDEAREGLAAMTAIADELQTKVCQLTLKQDEARKALAVDQRRYQTSRRHAAIDYANQFLPCSRDKWHERFRTAGVAYDQRWDAAATQEQKA